MEPSSYYCSDAEHLSDIPHGTGNGVSTILPEVAYDTSPEVYDADLDTSKYPIDRDINAPLPVYDDGDETTKSPQVDYDKSAEVFNVEQDTSKYPSSGRRIPFVSDQQEQQDREDQYLQAIPTSQLPWWRRPRYLIAIAFVSVAVITGLVVGVVIGTGHMRGSQGTAADATDSSSSSLPKTNSPPDKNSTATANGNSTILTPILTASVLGNNSATATQELFLFALHPDKSIQYISSPISLLNSSTSTFGSGSGSGWPTLRGGWKPLSSSSSLRFLNHPASIRWASGNKLSVAAPCAPDGFVRAKTIMFDKDGVPQVGIGSLKEEWEDLGGPVPVLKGGGKLSACALNGDERADWYFISGSGVKQNVWDGNPNATFSSDPNSNSTGGATGKWYHPGNGDAKWHSTADFGLSLLPSSRAGIVCRRDRWLHDLFVFAEDGSVRHASYNLEITWTTPNNRGGNFKLPGGAGEPVVTNVGSKRVDFFGIGEDRAVWWFTWDSEQARYTDLVSLGGDFQSVPSVVVTGSSELRVDVVGLGTNGRVWHRVMLGSRWVLDWEDLGVAGSSAPLVVNVGDSKVGAFVVGRDGHVDYAVWAVSSELSWKKLRWTSMGGNVTTVL